MGPEGLGIAQSAGAILEVIILLVFLQRKSLGRLLDTEFWRSLARMIFATIITGCIAYSMTKFFPLLATDDSIFATFPKFCLISGLSMVSYIVAGYFLDIKEVYPIMRRFKKILFGNIK